ncbi:MAG TPA: GNAT family N-acetyltransferase [Anaerolineae bacterium]
MRTMPVLATERLAIRPFVMDDLEAVHRLYVDIGWVDAEATPEEQLAVRREYVQWSALNHVQLARLSQPPYGDRAVVHKDTGHLIGMCGLVPYIESFGQLPYFGGVRDGLATAEMGIMWAIAPAYQRQGYATETARALADYAFNELRLKHIIATTSYDNVASQGVMWKIGMLIEKNPYPDPPWLQVVGILENNS